MRFFVNANIKLAGTPQIKQDFVLGDLTILIGKCNSGKTRILNKIYDAYTPVIGSNSSFDVIKQHFINKGLTMNASQTKAFDIVYISNARNPVDSIQAMSSKLSKGLASLSRVDPGIEDFGTDKLRFSGAVLRPMKEQGSGVSNHVRIIDILHDPHGLILIDEPEISHFPVGKIGLLESIMSSLDEKQIVLATHDPTFINQYLLKLLNVHKADIKIYSHSIEGGFKLVDYDSMVDPEIHVGYLSQTYSTKPVHLVVEGQTEFYLFQALIWKYAQFHNIPYYPKFINRIAISFVAGRQWKLNLFHLPTPDYYDVTLLLDGEYKDDLAAFVARSPLGGIAFNKVDDDSLSGGFKAKAVNMLSFEKKNIEAVFEEVFNEIFDKPLGLATIIWSLTPAELFKKTKNFTLNNDLKLIEMLLQRLLRKAGANY